MSDLYWFLLPLQCKSSVNRSRSSSISLTVESALESFDFLNTSDFDEDDVDEDGGGMVCNGGGADSVFSETEMEKQRYVFQSSFQCLRQYPNPVPNNIQGRQSL